MEFESSAALGAFTRALPVKLGEFIGAYKANVVFSELFVGYAERLVETVVFTQAVDGTASLSSLAKGAVTRVVPVNVGLLMGANTLVSGEVPFVPGEPVSPLSPLSPFAPWAP